MGRLQRPHLIEAAIFFAIVLVFYIYSFEFNQPIEIYIFGATAWPRVVILLLLIATAGNLYYHYKNGSTPQSGLIGAPGGEEIEGEFDTLGAKLRLVTILFTPFVFALLLKPVGIYFSAPFFIAAIIWLFGERRWKAILIMTGVIYFIFLGLFLVVLNAPLPQGNTSPFYDYSAWILKMNTQLQKAW